MNMKNKQYVATVYINVIAGLDDDYVNKELTKWLEAIPEPIAVGMIGDTSAEEVWEPTT
jgi:hypothetical protein